MKKLILASGGVLALVLPEMFEDFFDGLRQSQYFWLYQLGTIAWTLAFLAALLPWPKRQGKASIRVQLKSGPVRIPTVVHTPGGGVIVPTTQKFKPGVVLTVLNTGVPFELVARARIVRASPDLEWDASEEWPYDKRPVSGGDGQSEFCIATVDPGSGPDAGAFVIAVRSEGMTIQKRWAVTEPVTFDVEFKLYQDVESTLRHLETTVASVTLRTDGSGFDATLR